MKLLTIFLLSMFWDGYEQGVFLTTSNSTYDINPKFGSLTVSPGNSTHFGEFKLSFNEKISMFTFHHLMNSSNGNTIYNSTTYPCDKKAFKKMERLMRAAFGIKPTEKTSDFIPATWICPIEKGISIIKPKKRTMTLPLVVPTFLSNKGTYNWYETYHITLNKKKEVFLRSFREIVIDSSE